MRWLALVPAIGFAAVALGRTPDGALDLIRLPHEGQPAVVSQGETFEAVLDAEATLRLSGAAAVLETTSVEDRPGHYLCTIPEGTPEGLYALEAEAAGRTDAVQRAVLVKREYAETYRVAHIANPAVNADNAAARINELVEAARTADAALVLVTGDLTQNGDAAQFRALLEAMKAFTVPVYVTPGEADATGNLYTAYFGGGVYGFRYGPDGYLGFDTSAPIPADPLDNDAGRLYQFRRAIRPARWSIGFAEGFRPRMSMRAQLTLFVDDPLDYLVCGTYETVPDAPELLLPWERTRAIAPPVLFDGRLQIIEVTARAVTVLAPPAATPDAAKASAPR